MNLILAVPNRDGKTFTQYVIAENVQDMDGIDMHTLGQYVKAQCDRVIRGGRYGDPQCRVFGETAVAALERSIAEADAIDAAAQRSAEGHTEGDA